MPLSTVATGWGSLPKKAGNAASLYLNESEDDAAFNDLRMQVKGGTTDQGTESGILDETVGIIPRFRNVFPASDRRSFLFPSGLFIVGHLHVLYNALEESCKSLPVSNDFFGVLTHITAFLGDKDLRTKYQEQCSRPESKYKFNTCPRHHIDWRWEFLAPAIICVINVWFEMSRDYCEETMRKTETGKFSKELLRQVREALAKAWFPAVAAMFLCMAEVVDTFAGKLEGCVCHAAIWMAKEKFAQKKEKGFKSWLEQPLVLSRVAKGLGLLPLAWHYCLLL